MRTARPVAGKRRRKPRADRGQAAPSRGQRPRRTGTILARGIVTLIDAGVAAGLDRQMLLHAAAVKEADLADPDARLPLSCEVALWHVLSRRIADPGFAVRAAIRSSIFERGLLGYVFWFSPTLRSALRRLERFIRIFTEAVDFRFVGGGQPYVAVVANRALGAAAPTATQYAIVAALHSARVVTRVDIIPIEVTLSHEQPSATLALRQFCRCPLRFGAPETRVVLHARDLDLAIGRGDEQLATYLSAHADHVLDSLIGGESVQNQVRAAIWSALADGRPSLARIAATLGMAPRTLQRRLAGEGTSIQQEVEEVRLRMAIATLRDRTIAIQEVAYMLGYTESSTFFRSFRRWTGSTPRQYRQKHLGSEASDA